MGDVKCYLCGGREFSIRPGEVRDAPSVKVLECAGCGLVMLDSFKHVSASHYADSGMHGGSIPDMEHWLRSCATDDQRRFKMLSGMLVNRKVLDVGCGAGGFVARAAGVATSAEGVEPERRVRDYWGDRLQLHASMDDAHGEFDIITAFHVLEHVPEPRAMLSTFARKLAQGGTAVVEVPSADDVLLTLYESDAFRRFTYWSQHLYLFNPETMRRAVAGSGLRVKSIQQYQRYPLANHLHWLSRGKPGGHAQWSFLDQPGLNEAYASALASIGRCDTLIAYLEKA